MPSLQKISFQRPEYQPSVVRLYVYLENKLSLLGTQAVNTQCMTFTLIASEF